MTTLELYTNGLGAISCKDGELQEGDWILYLTKEKKEWSPSKENGGLGIFGGVWLKALLLLWDFRNGREFSRAHKHSIWDEIRVN